MSVTILALWLAGLLQLTIAAANFIVARRLDYRSNLLRLSPIVRQVFVVHAAYIVGVIVFFGLLCLLFAPALANGTPMMRLLTFGLAAFWGLRAIVHLTVYDRAVRARYRLEDLAFLLACAALTAAFVMAVIQ